jgi:Zn-dependent M28 family amino/carboxypeptidase
VDVHRVINLDMVGLPPDDGSVVVERDLGNVVATNDADSQAFGAHMVQAAHDYTDLPVQLGPIYASDYMPFEEKGYVAVGAFEGEGNPHYHRTSDTPDTLDYDYLAAVTRLVLATVLRAWRVVDDRARGSAGSGRGDCLLTGPASRCGAVTARRAQRPQGVPTRGAVVAGAGAVLASSSPV